MDIEEVKAKMTPEKVLILITALQVIGESDPVGVGRDEIEGVCRSALDAFNEVNEPAGK